MRSRGSIASLDTSPSSRRAWIEIPMATPCDQALQSPSSRRAWIEIPGYGFLVRDRKVALLAEGVDRN